MRGILFYALTELKRRTALSSPADFFAGGVIMWAAIFTGISFPGIFDMFSAASDESGAILAFALAEGVILLLLALCFYLVLSDRFKRHSREYSALANCGLSGIGFGLIQLIQTLLLFAADALTAIPAALALVNLIADRYNRRISEYNWLKGIDGLVMTHSLNRVEPGQPIGIIFAVTLLACFLTLLTSALACLVYLRGNPLAGLSRLRKRSGRISCYGDLLRSTDFRAYIRVTSKRLRRIMSRSGRAMSICFLLPFLLLIMSESFTPVKAPMDYVISTETMRNPIPESLASELEEMDGVEITRRGDGTEVYERLTGAEASEEKYSFIHFRITSEPERVIGEICDEIEHMGFEFSSPLLSRQITGVKYMLLKDYFGLLAALMLLCGIFAAAAITGDYFRYRSSEVSLLTRLGADSWDIHRLRFVSGMGFILSHCLTSILLGCSIYVPAAIGSGNTRLRGMAALPLSLLAALLISGAISLFYTYAEWRKERKA